MVIFTSINTVTVLVLLIPWNTMKSPLNPSKHGFSHGVPMVFPLKPPFSYGVPMVFPWKKSTDFSRPSQVQPSQCPKDRSKAWDKSSSLASWGLGSLHRCHLMVILWWFNGYLMWFNGIFMVMFNAMVVFNGDFMVIVWEYYGNIVGI
jgi:hypothetical protein